ncbi:HAD family hydrolase [Halolamina sp. C58]|uniref:HAD family hydrolase n=1 Tax=Halolamina sp. C58 TaxID=3421640 RepID=UPI003EBFC1B5
MRAVSFDCFGTLVAVPRPSDPAEAVAEQLRARGVAVPGDWHEAYTEPHLDSPAGAEMSLPAHVSVALSSRGIEADESVVEPAVLDAFDREVEPVPGAEAALDAVDAPVGVLSNCSMPGLVRRVLTRAELLDRFDTVVSSVDIGWRKPDRRAFATVADELDVPVEALTHVGDDRDADGGIDRYGGRYLHVDGDLTGLPERLADGEGTEPGGNH